jgi:RNA polymerase sigma-70 factor (ECF subfamily)
MTSPAEAPAPVDLDLLLRTMRSRLHRYCARMVGSVIDGEDVLQDALVKAVEAFAAAGPLHHPEAWLFRIAHNTALDFLRRRNRQSAIFRDAELDMIADEIDAVASRQIANASMRTFMRLPETQRACVILSDVLGCSLREVCDIMDTSLPAVKASLHRGRAQLRQFAAEPEDAPQPKLSDTERAQLAAYVAHFNARDFDAIRAMIADDVRLELVNRSRMRGKAEVGRYFGNYSFARDWRLAPGWVEGRPAILVFAPDAGDAPPIYFMLLGWDGDKVATIRDFRYATYVLDGAEYLVD